MGKNEYKYLVMSNILKIKSIRTWLRQLFVIILLDLKESELYFENGFKNDQLKDVRINLIITFLDSTYIKNDAKFPTRIGQNKNVEEDHKKLRVFSCQI